MIFRLKIQIYNNDFDTIFNIINIIIDIKIDICIIMCIYIFLLNVTFIEKYIKYRKKLKFIILKFQDDYKCLLFDNVRYVRCNIITENAFTFL